MQSTAVNSQNTGTPTPGAPSSATTSVGARGNSTVTFSWGSAPSTAPITNYHITISDGQQFDMGTATSKQITGNFGQAYSFTVTATSAGSTGPSRTSNSATPLDVLPFSIQLCYGSAYQGGNRLGVSWVNMPGGSHHITFPGFGSTLDVTGGGSGSAQSGAWSARNTPTDLNQQYSFTYDGANHGAVRWGDAPPC